MSHSGSPVAVETGSHVPVLKRDLPGDDRAEVLARLRSAGRQIVAARRELVALTSVVEPHLQDALRFAAIDSNSAATQLAKVVQFMERGSRAGSSR